MKLIVTAGPTRERIDNIRYITNRSSGKMGYAIAAAAAKYGFECLLISGPTNLEPPAGVEFIGIESAAEMAEAVKARFPDTDAVIMVAAVADYRPKSITEGKLKKGEGDLCLELERTEDILAAIGKTKQPHQTLVGFAAESENLEANAIGKLKRKNLDWIIANHIDDGFGGDQNKVTLYAANGTKKELDPATKIELAGKIIETIFGEKQ